MIECPDTIKKTGNIIALYKMQDFPSISGNEVQFWSSGLLICPETRFLQTCGLGKKLLTFVIGTFVHANKK